MRAAFPFRYAKSSRRRPTIDRLRGGTPNGRAGVRIVRTVPSPDRSGWKPKSAASRSDKSIGAGGGLASGLLPDARAQSRRMTIEGRDTEAQAFGGVAKRNLRIIEKRQGRPDVISFYLRSPAAFAPTGEAAPRRL